MAKKSTSDHSSTTNPVLQLDSEPSTLENPYLATKSETIESLPESDSAFKHVVDNPAFSRVSETVISELASTDNSVPLKSKLSTADKYASSGSDDIPPWKPSFRPKFRSVSDSHPSRSKSHSLSKASNSKTPSWRSRASSSHHSSWTGDEPFSSGNSFPGFQSDRASVGGGKSWRTGDAHSRTPSGRPSDGACFGDKSSWRSRGTSFSESSSWRSHETSFSESSSWRSRGNSSSNSSLRRGRGVTISNSSSLRGPANDSSPQGNYRASSDGSHWWRAETNIKSTSPAHMDAAESHTAVSFPRSQSTAVKKFSEQQLEFDDEKKKRENMYKRAKSDSIQLIRKSGSENQSQTVRNRQPNETQYPKKDRDRSWITRGFSRNELERFASLDSADLLNSLHSNLKRLIRTLELSQQKSKSRDFDLLMNVFFKLAECIEGSTGSAACVIIAEVLSERCAQFLLQLRLYCTSDFSRATGCTCYPIRMNSIYNHHNYTECRVNSLSTFFEKILETFPSSAWKTLPISEFTNNIKTRKTITNPNVLQTIESLELLYNETSKRFNKPAHLSQREVDACKWDNSEYRHMSIFPRQDELCTPDRPAKLRPSIVNGRYKDWMHYYDVQFRLLREDFTAPLRRGICGYIQGLKRRDLRDVRIYRNTTIIEPVPTRNGVNFKVEFDNTHLARCNWSHSKRLLHGSLLCLSCDKFNQIIFAVVTNRDEKELSEGKVILDFLNYVPMEHCTKRTTFVMIESSAYFEASRHIMASLQMAETDTMPFTQYLIANEWNSVALPHYLHQKKRVLYNLSSISTTECVPSKSSKSARMQYPLVVSEEDYTDTEDEDVDDGIDTHLASENTSLDILNDQCWQMEETCLDSSQLNALKMALTQEISLIQGPPGTGKTFIGIKIVEILLTNKSQWENDQKSPILVMCYTNHALDQFLEGIVEAVETRSAKAPKVIRVGGRSKSEKMAHFNIAHRRKEVFLPSEFVHTKYENEDDFFIKKSTLNDILENFNEVRNRNVFVTLERLKCVISPDHLYQLRDLAETTEEQEKALEIWLGLWEKQHSNGNEHLQHTQAAVSINSKPCDQDLPAFGTIPAHPNLGQSHKDTALDPQQINTPSNHSSETISNKQVTVHSAEDNEHPAENIASSSTGNSKGVLLTETAGETVEVEKSTELIDFEGEGTLANDARIVDINDRWNETYQNNASTQLINTENEGTLANNGWIVNEEDDIENEVENEPQDDDREMESIADKSKTQTQWIKVKNFEQVVMMGLWHRELLDTEVETIQSLQDIDIKTRWKLYNYWRAQLISLIEAECEENIAELNDCCKTMNENQKRADRFALETAEIIGMTTTGVAKYQHILHMVKPRIVIVEEAAEVLESHIVSALNAGTQHLILIGDHKQLKPKPNEYHLAKKYHMDVSLFERLIRNNFPYASLNIQHRMRPEIANLVRPLIYSDLNDHESVLKYEHVKGVQKDLFFLQHQHHEAHEENLLSYSNEYEARYVVSLCKYLLQQGYKPSQITILVTYTGQFLLVRSLMPRHIFEGVIMRTVDNYQGEENDLVLLSLVRSNKEGDMGFLREENRVCVSISRAKKGFYCIGNFTMFAENSELWKNLLVQLEKKELVGEQLTLYCPNHPTTFFDAKTPGDFVVKAPEGGCQLDCQFRLICGHVCAKKCHIMDTDHVKYRCKKPCTKKCPHGHNCPKCCCMSCGDCTVQVVRILPHCGHQKEMLCYQDPANAYCELPCVKTCPQGHTCPLECSKPCKKCVVKVPKLIPKCQHTQMVPCYQEVSTFLCKEDCSCLCQYGHACPKRCHEKCGPCNVEVEKTIPECFHKIILPCSIAPVHENCTMQCDKLLKCGHKCQSKCGEACTLICEVDVEKQLPCGHDVKLPCNQNKEYLLYQFECHQMCTKLLPCKHPCQKLCFESCTEECQITINKLWPCGHKLKRKCYQTKNPEKYPCNSKCRRTLSCGHPCTEKCGSPCVKNCQAMILKTLPCGHEKSLACHADVMTAKCEILCKAELACGHRCSGQCGNCFKKRIHHPCEYGFDLHRFCGHKGSTQCVGMSDVHPGKQKKHLAHCIHQDCSHDCSSPCQPCELPCPWTCPHYSCTKLCHEMCDRPSCNKKCSQYLKCGHHCAGVCGEQCLTVCPKCQPKEFMKLLAKQAHPYDEHQLYIQLSCKHIFTLGFMDRYVQNQLSKNEVISPLCCPNCRKSFSSTNYRYGNDYKQYSTDKERLQETIQRLSTQYVTERKATELHYRFRKSLATVLKAKAFKNMTVHNMLSKVKTKLLSLDNANIPVQENFLYHTLVNAMELFCGSSKHPANHESYLMTPACTYLEIVLALLTKYKCQLSIQIIQDLTSELYRLSLIQQKIVLKSLPQTITTEKEDESSEKPIPLSIPSEVEELLKELELNPSIRIDVTEFTQCATLLKDVYEEQSKKEFPVDSEKLVRDMRDFTPPTLKGVWRKCSRGHFYCTPLTIGKEKLSDCQECSSH